MTRYLILSCLLISFVNCFSQKEIEISFNKTTHLIFPTEIKYYSGVDELIILKKPLSNILSIKANEKDFGNSNLSVATADGTYYSFTLKYKEQAKNYAYQIKEDTIILNRNLDVNLFNLSHIILPYPVKYIDYGDDWIEASPIENIQNIVRVETLEEKKEDTNISIVDDNNIFYSFNVHYSDNASQYTINLSSSYETAILSKQDLTDDIKDTIIARMQKKGRNIKSLALKNSSILFSMYNIFVFKDKIIFKFSIENKSNIKYDIDYLKFYVLDKKLTKESALQEIEYSPLFIDNYIKEIQGKSSNIYSVCFEKFTIPDKKNFIIEINEKNGGRHIYFKIDNKIIENAQML